jgi:hypothetical protein
MFSVSARTRGRVLTRLRNTIFQVSAKTQGSIVELTFAGMSGDDFLTVEFPEDQVDRVIEAIRHATSPF